MPPPRKCKRMMRIPDKTILIEDSLPYGMDTSDTLNLPESEMQTLMNKFKEDPGDLVQKFATPPAPKFKPVTRRQQFGVRNDPELQDEEEQTGGKKKGKGKGRGKGKQDGTDGKEKAAKPRGGGSRKKPEDDDILEKEEETPDAPPKPSEESSARTQDLPDGETQTGNESQSRPAKAKRVQETNAPKAKKPKINEARQKTSLPSVEANGATGSSKKVEADETNLGKKTRKRTRQPAKTAEAVAGAGLVGERQKASGEEKVGVPAGNGTGGSNDGMDGNEKGEDLFWTFCTKRWADQDINEATISAAAHECANVYLADLQAS
ncbi:unnamed protein product [Durusdinium trenchii]|uniref:Uncharacterized protein n=1 Tax=Durusdinium trenchii TaxID=1381693 RepID=A0ABP0NLX0_9DINO